MSKLSKLLKSKAVHQGIKQAQKHVVPFIKKKNLPSGRDSQRGNGLSSVILPFLRFNY